MLAPDEALQQLRFWINYLPGKIARIIATRSRTNVAKLRAVTRFSTASCYCQPNNKWIAQPVRSSPLHGNCRHRLA